MIRHRFLPAYLLLAAGCAVGPAVTPAPAPATTAERPGALPATARGFFDSLAAVRSAAPPESITPVPAPLALDPTGDVAWLQVLDDSVLVGLVRFAMDHNRNLQVATARVREYRAQLGAARADFLPQLSANGTVSTNQAIFGAFPPQTYDVVRITADLSWELDFWGKLRRQGQAARFDLQAQDADRRATVLSLVSDIATAYLELRELDEDVGIAESTLVSRQATLALARRRFAEGLISELDVRQFEATVADPAARVAEFSRQRAQKENQLSLLLGTDPGPIARGRPLAEAVRAVSLPDAVSSTVLARRPDVQRADEQWRAATARIGVAMGNRLPRILLTGQYGTQRPDFSGLFGSSGEVYTLAGGISIPLFTGGRLVNQERAARARAEQGRAGYEQTVLTALREANDALVAVRTTRDQLVAQETQVDALTRATTLAEKRYQSGVSSYLEVLDAQRNLFTARLALASVRRQYLGTTVQLYKALGGSWAE